MHFCARITQVVDPGLAIWVIEFHKISSYMDQFDQFTQRSMNSSCSQTFLLSSLSFQIWYLQNIYLPSWVIFLQKWLFFILIKTSILFVEIIKVIKDIVNTINTINNYINFIKKNNVCLMNEIDKQFANTMYFRSFSSQCL